MSKPVRLRLSRKNGFNLQALSHAHNARAAVNVARPSKWGNPFDWRLGLECGGEAWAKACAVDFYRDWWRSRRGPSAPTDADLNLLRGKNLACWCKSGEPCHADVLLELANADQVAA